MGSIALFILHKLAQSFFLNIIFKKKDMKIWLLHRMIIVFVYSFFVLSVTSSQSDLTHFKSTHILFSYLSYTNLFFLNSENNISLPISWIAIQLSLG